MKSAARPGLMPAVVAVFACVAALAGPPETHRFLVVYDPIESPGSASLPYELDRAEGFYRFRHINVFSVILGETEAADLALDSRVISVERDRTLYLTGFRVTDAPRWDHKGPLEHQRIPYGVRLARAPAVWHVSRGRGVRVGVIDSGLDTAHPDLAERFRGGHDFVEGDDEPQDIDGHGTHVAGTLAASDNDKGVVGVAPEVDLYALRVFAGNGLTTTFRLIEAIDWAIDPDGDGDTSDHLDIVNMSLGSVESSNAELLAIQRASEAGVIFVAAAGNNFSSPGTVNYPAAYQEVIAVGAVDANEVIGDFSERGPEVELVGAGVEVSSTDVGANNYQIAGRYLAQRMEFSSMPERLNGELIFAGNGRGSEFPAETLGKIALIERGPPPPNVVTFAEKAANAKAAGAIAAIIFNHEEGSFQGTLCGEGCSEPPVDPIAVVSVSREDGLALLDMIGMEIELARYPYATRNGTSMAAPHVSGIIALLLELAPGATEQEIRSILALSARDLGDPGRDELYGFGLADAAAAARMLDPESFPSLGRRRAVRRPD